MSTKRRIVVASLDTPVRSIVSECLPTDHFDIEEFDENTSVAFNGPGRPGDLPRAEGLGADSGTLRDAAVAREPECPVALLREQVGLPTHGAASWQRRAEYDHYAV
jgi:hypothetical protein